MKKIVRPIVIFAVIATPLVLFAKGGFSFTFSASDADYSNVMRDGIENGSARVVDIAMLGAHDAFSHLINADSPIDPGEPEDSLLRNGSLQKFGDGVFVRLSKAQKSGAGALLDAGVRYLDVRLSYFEDEWYTKHGLISGKLSGYLDETIAFLAANPGEFIIFDMQHVYMPSAVEFSDLFAYLDTYEFEGNALTDFIHYDPLSLELRDLTYDVVTESGVAAGAIILAKTPASIDLPFHYNRGNGDTAIINIRSIWHNTSDTTTLVNGIKEEYEYLQSTVIYEDILRVNQAQKTGSLSGSDLWDTILGWSLLDMANNSNATLIEEPDFEEWFTALPILMVDFADSTKGNFNETANDAIIAYNKML